MAEDLEIEQLDDPESFINNSSLFQNSYVASATLTYHNLQQPNRPSIEEESKGLHETNAKRLGGQLNVAQEKSYSDQFDISKLRPI